MNIVQRMTTGFSRLSHIHGHKAENEQEDDQRPPVLIKAYRLDALDLKESLKLISDKIDLSLISLSEQKNNYLVYLPKDVVLTEADVEQIYAEKRKPDSSKVIDRNTEWEDPPIVSGNTGNGVAVVPVAGPAAANIQAAVQPATP